MFCQKYRNLYDDSHGWVGVSLGGSALFKDEN